jgi:hypothetical protein
VGRRREASGSLILLRERFGACVNRDMLVEAVEVDKVGGGGGEEELRFFDGVTT